MSAMSANELFQASAALLCCRSYDPDGGRITVGGNEIHDVTMSSLRTKFGAVPQVMYFLWLRRPHML